MKTTRIIDLTSEHVEEHSSLHTPYSGCLSVSKRDEALKELNDRLSKAFWLTPDRQFFLAPLDPGSGKTSFLCDFIRKKKSEGHSRKEGILLCFSTKVEIEKFITASGLDEADYAVQTSDHIINGRGLGYHAANDAWVLLTTHQMVRYHAGTSFEKAEKFYFNGKPRRLRIWDEALDMAEPISIRLDDIGALYGPLRLHHEKFVETLEAHIPSSAIAIVGDTATIPSTLIVPSKSEAEAVFGKGDARIDLLVKLDRLKGQPLDIGEDKRLGKALIGHIHVLPNDFAPVFILDGSGRLKHSYRLHEAYRKNLWRLAPYQHDYSNLTVRWWKRASGKTTMLDPSQRKEIAEAAAARINSDDDEWLVITHKDDDGKRGYSLQDEIKDLVNFGKRRVSFIHWGIHKATNEYADIKKVMVIGLCRYPESVYRATYRASAGMSANLAAPADLDALRRSETQEHLLQAVSRSNVRNADADGKCGDAEVYIIAPAVMLNDAMLMETFPGCSVTPWVPIPKALSKQAAQLVEEIKGQLSGGTSSIAKKSVRDALGIKASALSRHLREKPVQVALAEHGIRSRGKKFEISTHPREPLE